MTISTIRVFRRRVTPFAFTVWALPLTLAAATLQVGPGKPYSRPCAAIAAAAAGDIIEVDAAGSYDGDVCAVNKNNLTIRGMGGRARIDAAGKNSQGKAIWVVSGSNVTIENIELSGAAVPDRNGAGIRAEGTNLTIRNCYFHNNEMGILAADNLASQILVENSEFGYNGRGDGYTHNIYINHVGRFTFRYNYSHHSDLGQLVKTRAAENYILYNRLTAEAGSNVAYEIGVPNGGRTYIIGNLVHQSANTSNSSFIDYMLEGSHASNPSRELFVINNTFVNDRTAGATFVNIQSGVSTPAVIRNNLFIGGGTITTQGSAVLSNNFTGDPLLVNRNGYDYRLQAGSPAINAGMNPGTGAGYSLTPVSQYLHTACSEGRASAGTIDIGAYEYSGSGQAQDCGGAPVSATLQALFVSPVSVTGGQSSSGQVTLDRNAPAGGAAIALSSSSGAAVPPSSVTVPAGQSSASFTISTSTVATTTAATITAQYAGVTRTTGLTIIPAGGGGPALSSIVLAQSSATGGATISGNTVSLTSAAPAGGVAVALSSSNTGAATVPASVTVAQGSTSATFAVTTKTVSSATSVTITASYAGNSRAAALTVNPASGSGEAISIWPATAIPAVLSDPDTNAVELGVKFRSSVAGQVTGVRFYKASTNRGTHTGSLWSANGTRLATVTFTNETSSGWQQATFSTPVTITANTTYVVSYYAPRGRYSADSRYFTGKGAVNGPLQALASGVNGGNGVYRYGTSSFPTSTYNDCHYWVDVVFRPQ